MNKVKVIAIATASALAVAGVAGTAVAAAGGYISQATTSYSSPSNKAIPVDFLAQGTAVETLCFTEGQELRNSNLWFKVAKDGRMGFVHRDTIGGIQGDLRHC